MFSVQDVPYGTNETLDAIRRSLWRCWSAGNYARDARLATSLVKLLEKRIRNMVDVPKAAADNGKFYFVNVGVGEDDVAHIDELFPTPDVTFNLLTGVLIEGLKVSFAVNAKNDMTICSLSDRRVESPTFGACLTGGADGWYDSLCVVLYKYTALLQGDLANANAHDSSTRRIM